MEHSGLNFETVIARTEWDPVLFTKILNDCRPKLHQTLDKSSIFSYACREHSTVIVQARQVAIKGFLKMQGVTRDIAKTLTA